MSINQINGENSPAGILKHWQNKTKYECAREILQCYQRIENLHRDLLAIHRITSNIAGIKLEPHDYSQTLTVRRVKEMAHMINWMSSELQPNAPQAEPGRSAPGSYITTLTRAIALMETEQAKLGPDSIGDVVWFDTDIDRLRELVAEQRVRAHKETGR